MANRDQKSVESVEEHIDYVAQGHDYRGGGGKRKQLNPSRHQQQRRKRRQKQTK